MRFRPRPTDTGQPPAAVVNLYSQGASEPASAISRSKRMSRSIIEPNLYVYIRQHVVVQVHISRSLAHHEPPFFPAPHVSRLDFLLPALEPNVGDVGGELTGVGPALLLEEAEERRRAVSARMASRVRL